MALHLGVLTLAVVATANARSDALEKSREEKLNYVEVKNEEPKPEEPKPEEPKPKAPEPAKAAPRKAPSAPRVGAPAPPRGFQILQAPVNIPVSIPEVDLSAVVTNEADFSGRGVAGGSSKGVEGGTGDAKSKGTVGGLSNQPYFEFQVEEAATPSGGNAAPEYPNSMRESGMIGRVVVQFVVGANGRVESGSIKVLESTNSAFAAAVREVLPRHRFSPAKIGGRAVRQLVQQPFVFRLSD
ncbi:MAG: energy transducer TonB [Gemmatimonadaceae bacterium]